jgi:hypothetical protein
MGNKILVTPTQIAAMKRYYCNGLSAEEAGKNVSVPLGNIKYYYQQFKQDGLTKTSELAQTMLQVPGILRMPSKTV